MMNEKKRKEEKKRFKNIILVVCNNSRFDFALMEMNVQSILLAGVSFVMQPS
jgi:hypothetical protein